jgi:hypothetical protein
MKIKIDGGSTSLGEIVIEMGFRDRGFQGNI